MSNGQERLIIVSNRLPFLIASEDGRLTLQAGSGGLVTALAPVLRNRGGLWIGWPGIDDASEEEVLKLTKQAKKAHGFSFFPVMLTKEEVDLYYYGFSNEIVWPLFHDLQSQCNFVPKYWQAYQEVNRKFADAIGRSLSKNDFIWVHDYQLMTTGLELRQKGVQNKIGFFLHIPFPPLDIFLKLPWRFNIMRALLEYDLIGLQTGRDRRNFIQALRALLKDVKVRSQGNLHVCTVGNREVRIGAFPISIDFSAFSEKASQPQILEKAKEIHKSMHSETVILSLDRLDYTKGIPCRLEAIRFLLNKYPELHQKLTLVQVVIPSRVDIPKYQALKESIDQLVGKINSEFTQNGWVPIHYMFRCLSPEELLAHYRAAEIALITPLKDGMNLVAKEYVAATVDENGVLILSEFAGAASQLSKEALLVNPCDIEGLADTIYKAVQMPKKERKARMRKMRRTIWQHDIFWWVRTFLTAAFSKDLKDFPVVEEFIPEETSAEAVLT